MAWTKERIEFVRGKFEHEGLSAAQIADLLGDVTRNAVLGKIWRLGLCKAHPRPSRPKRQKQAATRAEPKQRVIRPDPIPVVEIDTDDVNDGEDRPFLDTSGDECKWLTGTRAGILFACAKPTSRGVLLRETRRESLHRARKAKATGRQRRSHPHFKTVKNPKPGTA